MTATVTFDDGHGNRHLTKGQKRANAEHRRDVVAVLLSSHRTYRQMIVDLAGLTPPIKASLSMIASDVKVILTRRSERAADALDVYVAEQMAQLDQLMGAFFPMAMSGDYKAAERVMAILERVARLKGLDEPARHEFSGPLGGPIQMDVRTPEQLRARALAILDRIQQKPELVEGEPDTSDVVDAELIDGED